MPSLLTNQWALTNEVGHCLRFVVTSRALSNVGDIHVVQMLNAY